MSVTHDECRDAVAAGEAGAAGAAAHINECSDCRDFAEQVAQLDRRAATMLAPSPAPAALADRVVGQLALEGRRQIATATLLRRQAVLAVAAAIALIIGVVSFLGRDGRESRTGARQALSAAASRFENDGASTVTVDAATSIDVAAEGRDADFSDAPAEVRGYLNAQWERLIADFERQLAQFEAHTDAMLSQFDQRMNNAFGGGGRPGGTPSAGPPATRGDGTISQPARPDRASLTLHVRAQGAVDPALGAQLEGTVTASPGTIPVPTGAASFAVDVSPTGQAFRNSDGSWVQATRGVGPLGAFLLDARAIPSILRASADKITRRGPASLANGDEVTRYAFVLGGEVVGDGTASWRVTVSIDKHGRIRSLRLLPTGGRLSTRTEVTVEVHRGAKIDAARRPSGVRGSAGGDTASPLAAVAPAVRAALVGSSR